MSEGRPKGTVERIERQTVALIFRRAEAAAFSGRMIFRRGHQSISFFLQGGFIVNARTNNPSHRLGEVVKSRQGLDDAGIGAALKLAKASGKPLGMILLAEKMIRPKDLYQCLVAQVELMVREVAGWDSGTCYLNEGIPPGAEVVPLRVSSARLVEAEPEAPVKPEAPAEPEALVKPEAPVKRQEPAEPRPAAEPAPPDKVRASKHWDEELFRAFLRVAEGVREGDHYELLGVKQDAGPDEVRTAYQAMVRSWHPDRAGHRISAGELQRLQEVFSRLNAGYAILSDKERRVRFDRDRKESLARPRAPKSDLLSPVEEARRLHQAGLRLLKEEQPSMALDYFRRAGLLDPTQARYFYYLGAACYKCRRFKQAEEALLKAIDLEGSSPDYYVALGRVYREGKMLSRAADMFQRALKWDPRHPGALREKKILDDLMRQR